MRRDRRSDRPPERRAGSGGTGAPGERSSGALNVAARALVGLAALVERATRPVQRMWRSDDPLDTYTLVHLASVAGPEPARAACHRTRRISRRRGPPA